MSTGFVVKAHAMEAVHIQTKNKQLFHLQILAMRNSLPFPIFPLLALPGFSVLIVLILSSSLSSEVLSLSVTSFFLSTKAIFEIVDHN